MPTEVITLANDRDYERSVDRAVALLQACKLVAFPTETVYGVGARGDRAEAVAGLRAAKGRGQTQPFTLHVGRADDVHRYVPSLSGVARRFIRKGWPGPLTLIFDVGHEYVSGLSEKDSGIDPALLYHEGTIGIRYPADQVACDILSGVDGPVVAASANLAGNPPPRSAEGVLAEMDGLIDLVVDGGSSRYAKPSTIVLLQGDSYKVLREGVIESRTVERWSRLNLLFVCSGNTCRSPMAAALCGKVIGERLGCGAGELSGRGVEIQSAGTFGGGGMPASSEAMAVMSAMGLDLSLHESRGLDADVVGWADRIYCMTRSHVDSVLSISPGSNDKVELLAGDAEISDPFGGSREVYKACAEELRAALKQRVTEIDV